MTQESVKPYTITLDDDPIVRRLIETATGLRSLAFISASAFRRRARRYQPHAVFVDVMLGSGETGIDLIPTMRTWWPFCPIIVVTASPGDEAVGMALASGANDYVRKPISGRELAARLHARTVEMAERARRQRLAVGDTTLDLVFRRLEAPGGFQYLSEIDVRLFSHLAAAPDAVVPREELKRALWGEVKVSNNALDKRLSELRQALRVVGSGLALTSSYGVGVRLALPRNFPTVDAA